MLIWERVIQLLVAAPAKGTLVAVLFRFELGNCTYLSPGNMIQDLNWSSSSTMHRLAIRI